ncbi:hypothetical protein AWENTII_005592 [Aspergillus wentii]
MTIWGETRNKRESGEKGRRGKNGGMEGKKKGNNRGRSGGGEELAGFRSRENGTAEKGVAVSNAGAWC